MAETLLQQDNSASAEAQVSGQRHLDSYSALVQLEHALETHLSQKTSPLLPVVDADVRQDTEVDQELLLLIREFLSSPASSPEHEDMCEDLASQLWARWKKRNCERALTACIEIESELLNLHSPGHPNRAKSCGRLAVSLSARYSRTGESSLLDKVIHLEGNVLELRPVGHPARARACGNLALSLWTKYGRVGEIELLDRAITLQQEALELRPVGHSLRATSCGNLALFLWTQFKRTGDSMQLDRAIGLQREALDLAPAGVPTRVFLCGGLASSLWTRYRQTADSTLLDEAIQLQQEALELSPVGHTERAASCGSFALSLWTRYSQTGESALLDEAIELHREALDLRPKGHPNRAGSCEGLANSLRDRYTQTRASALLDEIIELQQEVLEVQPVGHPDRGRSCGNLANSLWTRYSQTRESASADEAIELYQEAIDLWPVGHYDRARSLGNLASLLRTRYMQTDDSTLLSRATELLDEALITLPRAHPLRWRIYCLRAGLGRIAPDGPDWQGVLGHLHQTFSAPSYDDINALLGEAVPELLSIERSSLSDQQQHVLLTLYARAVDIATVSISFALDESTQLQHTLNLTALGLASFHLALQNDQALTAIQLLDRTRGVIWSQLLRMRDPQLDGVPLELAEKMQGILGGTSREYHNQHDLTSQQMSISTRNTLYQQRSQLQDVMRDIRALPGMNDFMSGPDTASLLAVARQNPVVVLVAGKDAIHAVVITSTDTPLYCMSLEDVNVQTLQDTTLHHILRSQRGVAAPPVGTELRGMYISRKKAPDPLGKLWRMVVKPILQRIGLEKAEGHARPRIHWCPTGSFAFVPLHAAGIYEGSERECCSDYVVSSYTPTLSALIQARRNNATITPSQIKLLAIAAERALEPGLPRLWYASSEVTSVLDIITRAGGTAPTRTEAATPAEVLSELETTHIFHLACHGVQDPEPHKSCFYLSTGSLSVSELMNLELKHSLVAFLSACETAKGDQKHADEGVHLAAAMLFAGFKSVVATMWAMNDEDGPFVAKLFYKRLFEAQTIEMDSVAYALDHAVAALRAKGAPPEHWATFIHMGA